MPSPKPNSLHRAELLGSANGWHVFVVHHEGAHDWTSPPTLVAGGLGGHRHTWRCPPRLALIGLETRADDNIIFAFEPICDTVAHPDAARRVTGPLLEGGRAPVHPLLCPPGTAVSGVVGTSTQYVQSITLQCRAPGRRDGEATTGGSAGGPSGAPYDLRCPEGELVSGVGGRFGSLVDAIELECRPPP